MSLTTPECIEIVERSGGRSARVIAVEFNARHPERENISHAAVFNLLKKLHEMGSVHDKDRPGRPRAATAEDKETAVVATIVKSPKRSFRHVASLAGISQRSVLRVLHVNKWHPYKLQLEHRLTEDDPRGGCSLQSGPLNVVMMIPCSLNLFFSVMRHCFSSMVR
jgi:transposase